jgi:hypothetical protein
VPRRLVQIRMHAIPLQRACFLRVGCLSPQDAREQPWFCRTARICRTLLAMYRLCRISRTRRAFLAMHRDRQSVLLALIKTHRALLSARTYLFSAYLAHLSKRQFGFAQYHWRSGVACLDCNDNGPNFLIPHSFAGGGREGHCEHVGTLMPVVSHVSTRAMVVDGMG